MKNPDQEPKENEEIQNPEQFQIDRSSGKAAEGHLTTEDDDEGYTAEEIPFADGSGSQLDETIDKQEETKDDDEI
ncbi:MAG: hypothetical protein EOO86_01495 [Pedobacter sp.]|nr:MAG: hypothetical protein EOO86_01495 [Pedobacter sp.]